MFSAGRLVPVDSEIGRANEKRAQKVCLMPALRCTPTSKFPLSSFTQSAWLPWVSNTFHRPHCSWLQFQPPPITLCSLSSQEVPHCYYTLHFNRGKSFGMTLTVQWFFRQIQLLKDFVCDKKYNLRNLPRLLSKWSKKSISYKEALKNKIFRACGAIETKKGVKTINTSLIFSGFFYFYF